MEAIKKSREGAEVNLLATMAKQEAAAAAAAAQAKLDHAASMAAAEGISAQVGELTMKVDFLLSENKKAAGAEQMSRLVEKVDRLLKEKGMLAETNAQGAGNDDVVRKVQAELDELVWSNPLNFMGDSWAVRRHSWRIEDARFACLMSSRSSLPVSAFSLPAALLSTDRE